jgi:hypothetical protein
MGKEEFIMNVVTIETLKALNECGFELEKVKQNSVIYSKKWGSLSNGADITLEAFPRITHECPFEKIHLKGRQWAFDGDNYEIDNDIDLWTRGEKLVDLCKVLGI